MYEDNEELRDVTAWDEGLKTKERLFLLEMCTSEINWMNPEKAYQEIYKKYDKINQTFIYPNDRAAQKGANRMLKKPVVKEALKKLLLQSQPELDEMNVYKVLHEMQVMAFFNPADILDDKGQLKKPLEELGDLAKCVKQIKPGKFGTEIVLEDRYKYVEAIAKYLNIIRPEVLKEVKLQVVEVAPKVIGNDLMDAVDVWNAEAAKE